MSVVGGGPELEEYRSHVWDHTTDPFQMSFDVRRDLDTRELWILGNVIERLELGDDDKQIAAQLRHDLATQPSLIDSVMQVVGLTRNKIITDLKAASSTLGLRVPSKPAGVIRRDEIWAIAGPYLARKLRTVLEPLTQLERAQRELLLQALNQATYPGWIRQERAKLQGHEAEHRVAVMLFDLGFEVEPSGKVDKPTCPDCRIEGISFDIVVPSVSEPVLVVKATVQTANIGQFGESKVALEIEEARQMLERKFSAASERPTLFAIVDGVGFYSNSAGLSSALTHTDEFAQFSTIWKIAVVAAARLERPLTVALPQEHIDIHRQFLDRWGRNYIEVVVLDADFRADADPAMTVDAGEAVLVRGL